MKLLILTPIAERDVHFYLATAALLRQHTDLKVVFLSFFQPGNELIRQNGYEVLDPYASIHQSKASPWSTEEIEKNFQTPPLKDLLLHEKLTFGLHSDTDVLNKFRQFFFSIDQLLADLEKRYPAQERYILQELAGFVGPLSLFYTGIKRGWVNWMTEPSFFKGRIHLLRDNLYLHIPACTPTTETEQMVSQYIKQALEQKVVVAAVKDAHHYKDMGFAKVFNKTNFQKLTKKLYFKYIKGEKQEFDHIWNHASRYLLMLKNRMENSKVYSSLESLPKDQKIFYFPFHVQLDFSLTIRSPDWLDQLALIEKVLQQLPPGTILAAKEHPASIGCLDQSRLKKVLQHPQFRLLHPQINSHDVLDRATGVVTINSKVGAEALSKGLPVLSFGNAFYTNKGYTQHFSNWSELPALFTKWLDKTYRPQKSAGEWNQFLNCVWQDSFPTELYDLRPGNIRDFTDSVANVLKI
jgi:hypothetical protein